MAAAEGMQPLHLRQVPENQRAIVPGLINRATALTGQHSPRMLVLPLAKRLWRRQAL